MGLSSSKRVSQTLRSSADFNSACDSVFEQCLDLTQHTFQGVKPYQLASASDLLHQSLTLIHYPLVEKWVRDPPTRSQVDKAFRSVTSPSSDRTGGDAEIELGPAKFRDFGVELYADAVVSNAGKAVLARVPIAVAGIVGLGVATRSGKDLVGAAIGVYAVGAAASFYMGLTG